MRKIKRFFARHIGEFRIAPRRAEVAAALQTHFSLPAQPQLLLSGSRGHDSIYRVAHAGKTLGMLRLVNPYRKRKKPAANMPFVSVGTDRRAAREYEACQAGAAAGLTPNPVWHATDALCCDYMPLSPLHARLEKNGAAAWDLIVPVTQALRRLHALGVVHADVSLANTLGDDTLAQIVFVDFEYEPAPYIGAGAARLYDYLRLVESSWKFLPQDKRSLPQNWLALLSDIAREEGIVRADVAPLLPALSQLCAAGVIAQIENAL
ncbi:MAG TPA: hypothetical protein PLX33_07590 [Alphaproteobacteria bacterium]|nr:hypothetical protein [Alphaproteobacteria bacterium]